MPSLAGDGCNDVAPSRHRVRRRWGSELRTRALLSPRFPPTVERLRPDRSGSTAGNRGRDSVYSSAASWASVADLLPVARSSSRGAFRDVAYRVGARDILRHLRGVLRMGDVG